MVWWRFSWLVLSIPFVGFSCKKGPIVQSGKKAFLWQILLGNFFAKLFELFCPNHNRLTMWSFQSDRMSWRNFVHFLFLLKSEQKKTFLFFKRGRERKKNYAARFFFWIWNEKTPFFSCSCSTLLNLTEPDLISGRWFISDSFTSYWLKLLVQPWALF